MFPGETFALARQQLSWASLFPKQSCRKPSVRWIPISTLACIHLKIQKAATFLHEEILPLLSCQEWGSPLSWVLGTLGSKKTRACELLKQCNCRKGVTCCSGVECVLRHGGTRALNLQLGLGGQLPSRFFKITEKVGYPCWSTLNFCHHVPYVCTNVCAYLYIDIDIYNRYALQI